MTQSQFAEAIGCSKATVVSLEIGRMQVGEALIAKMSILSGIDVLTGTGAPITKQQVESEYLRRRLQDIQL